MIHQHRTRTGDAEIIDVRWLRENHRVTLVRGHVFTDGGRADGFVVSGRCQALIYVGSRWQWRDVYFVNSSPRMVTLARSDDGRCLFLHREAVADTRFYREVRPRGPTRLDLERRTFAIAGDEW
jgi:hypothetical protein